MDDEFPLDANGPAYTSRQEREGVPLAYVAEKLGRAIEELHRYARSHSDRHGDLLASMTCWWRIWACTTCWPRPTTGRWAARLLNTSEDELRTWLALIEREGDFAGLTGLDQP
jgi:hypothetical protein